MDNTEKLQATRIALDICNTPENHTLATIAIKIEQYVKQEKEKDVKEVVSVLRYLYQEIINSNNYDVRGLLAPLEMSRKVLLKYNGL